MNTELQDKAWSVLPKEFKEEVKKLYHEFTFTREGYYVGLFGLHNLTSDSEKLSEPKPSEPRFKVGDHVRVISKNKYGEDGYIVKVEEEEAGFYYTVAGIEDWRFFEPNLEPYTEPEEDKAEEIANKAIEPVEKHFDNILKDSFRNERRLNIAAMAMQGILSNPQLLKIVIETYQEEIGSYMLWRNDRTCAFRKELLNMASESARKAIDECKFGEWEKPYDVLDKHSYESMLYFIKPLKLEAWFTEQEIRILKGGSYEN